MANWFIGLPVPPEALPDGLLTGLPAGLRRMPIEDLHVTVAFLGAVGASRASRAWACTRAMQEGPFDVSLGCPAALGRPDRPSAYGLDLEAGAEPVRAFIDRWREALREAAGQPPESRPARPHITLARPPRRAGRVIRERADRWLRTYRPPSADPIRLERIALYTWSDERPRRLFRIVESRTLPAAA